jgi:hypothetical protein
MNDLMSLIDDVKDSIGDGKYLELCNAMKNMYEKKEEPKLYSTPIEDIVEIMQRTTRNTLIWHDVYHSKYRLKKDRKLTSLHGTTSNIYIPHSIILDSYSLVPEDYGDVCTYRYETNTALTYIVKLHTLTDKYQVIIAYNDVVIFRSNDFIEKKVTHEKYND